MRVALQPCGNPEGKANFRETVESPVDLSTRTNLIHPRHVDEIWNLYPPDGTARIWGVLGSLRTQWEELSRGDLVLFLMDKKVVFSGRVGLKFENEELARSLWGSKENGDTWGLIYTLTGGEQLSIPKEDLRTAMGANPADSIMSFRLLDEEKSARVLRELSGLKASAITATENDYEESVDAEKEGDPGSSRGNDPMGSQVAVDEPGKDYLREDLLAIASGIGDARTQPYPEHPLAKLIRGRWAEDLRRSAWSDIYRTKGSAGSGNWAEVVWAAIFNRLVTDSATRGYYLTYLVSPTGEQIVLTLMLGTTEILDKYKHGRYEEVLRTNAASDLELLANEDTSGLVTGPVSNGGSGTLARGYEAGTIAAIRYERGRLPDNEELRRDLDRMLKLYQALFDTKAELEVEVDVIAQQEGTKPGQSQKDKEVTRRERRRLVTHRRAERNPALSRDAKKLRGDICEVPACGKDLRAIYGDLLGNEKNLVEAHHIVPFSQLDENVELDPGKDFRVVCPDCHRAIHQRRPEPYTLEEISAAIKKSNEP
jgi:5-methylcytosine-specific restriction protein A